jgi:cobalt/nickel transport system permease protein
MPPALQPADSVAAYLSAVDPRARLFFAIAFSILAVWMNNLSGLIAALAASMIACCFSSVPIGTYFKRLWPLEIVFLLLAICLSLAARDSADATHQGLLLATVVALKGNAIAIAMISLVGSIEPVELGRALEFFRVPQKLSLLLLFTIRYVEVLHREYARLRTAMLARAFRPGMNRHTYRTFGYLAGMLLIRSLDRSERILSAMKCRGFDGRFYAVESSAFSKRDLPFCLAASLVLALLVGMELCPI